MLIGFLYFPLLINYLNAEKYGIWLTLSSIIGWFSFFNLGLGNGLKNKFAEAIAIGDNDLGRVYVSTTYAILIMIFSVILIFFYIINPFLDWSSILNTDTISKQELSLLALLVFSFFVLKFIFNLISIIISADQRPALANLFDPVSNLIIIVIILILLEIQDEGSILMLGFLLSATPVIVLIIATFYFFNNQYHKYKPSIKYVQFSMLEVCLV
jgi:O-antigen/teichoic acid export membrane protein